MTESTRKSITQLILPGLFLFGALVYMHGPGYVQYFRKHMLAYSMQRDSLFGPVKYSVRLKAMFTDELGEECMVYVITDLAQSKTDTNNHEELLLVDKWSKVIDRKVEANAGSIRSTHLSPQDGYAVLEIVRDIPQQSHRMAQVVHYQISREQIAMTDSETRDMFPKNGWHNGWRNTHGRHPGWGRRGPAPPGPPPTQEQIQAWHEAQKRQQERRRDRQHDDNVADTDNDRRSRQKQENMERPRPVGTDNQRLLDVGSLGRSRDEATKIVALPR